MRAPNLILFGILVLSSYCVVEDASINFVDAYIEIQKAVEYKQKECGNRPPNDFIPPPNIDEDSLRLCSLYILRLPCPFDEYPIYCYDLYWNVIFKE
ncbi:MAG: hypothetical protein NZ853_08395 [Leptospiraceae bacterium]|nr:hypothetical protein [Leptospiraceae bacterium]MDW7976806.1 hypothetical protein [Leptospiraceae bacterium]